MKKRIALLILVVSIAILVGTLTACSGDPRCVDGHSWFDVAEVQVADCTNPGIVYGRCSKCGIRRMPETPALGHDLVLVPGTAIEPTCDEDGYEGDFECARDNCTHLEHGAIIPALGHKDEDGDGNCDNCGGNPCNHVWGDWIDNGDGTHSRTCTLDSSHVETAPHNIGEGIITGEPSCDSEGEIEYFCQDCDYSHIDSLPALGHDYPDTWTDNGENHIKVCANGCGEDLIENHTYVEVSRTEADCENGGVVVYDCVCGSGRDDITPAHGHAYGMWIDDRNETTHTKVCANDGTHTITEEHNFVEIDRMLATCETEEVVTYQCEDCGFEYSIDVAPALGHDYPDTWTDNGDGTHIKVCGNGCGIDLTEAHTHEETSRVDADCENAEVITYTCVCGNSYTEEGAPALGHILGDYTDNGDNTHTRVCINGCGYDLTEDHDHVLADITPADCENAEVITYTCVCGDIYTEEGAPALGHDYPDTWIDNGDGTHIKVCGNDESHVITEAHSHTETSRVDADCENDGTITYTCVCNNIKTETIPATGHAYGQWIDDENGTSHTRVCANDSAHTETENHNLVETNRIPATCTEAEKITSKCEDCGYECTVDGEPALGHDYPDTWTDNGDNHIKVCANGCGVDLTEAHEYPDTWTEDGTGITGKHIKTCTAEGCDHTIEEEHIFESEENYYSKKVGTWTNAAGTDTRDLIDVFWGKYCSTCGWVQIEEMPRKVDSTDVELLFDNCEIATEVNSITEVVENYVVYPVSDFDQMYRLMTYGYSVKLTNDIEIPATGNNPQLGSNETGGYKAITVNQGTFRGMQYPFVILDLDEYTLSSTFVGSTNGSGVYTQYAPLRTNTSMLIDGTNGGSINVKELVLVNNGGSIVEFRGGTYTSEGNNIADMNSTSAEVYASRVYVKDPTTTFIVADTDDAEIFTASYKRPAPEEGETGRMIAVLDAGVYYHWQPSTYNTDGWISTWVRHVENYDAERDAYIIPYEHNYNSRKVITEATCEADGLGQWYCGCGDTEGTTYTIPALGHDYVWTDNGDGTHIKVCANGCGVNLTEAHTHEETDRVDATCENDGTITYTCVCGNIKTETIPALGHTVYPSDYTACIVCGKNTYSSSYKVNITDYIGRYGFICYSDVAKSGRKLDGAEDSLGNVFMWNDGRTIRRIYEHGVVIQAGVNAETVAFMLPSGNYLALDNDGNIISVPEVNEYSSWTYSGGALQNLATNLYLAGPVDQHSPFTTTPELDLEKTKMQFNLFAEKITVLDCEHDYVIKEEVAGNCVEVGYIIYDCVICGHLYEEKTTLGDHNYVWTDNGDGTCTGICQNDNSHTVTEEHTITSDGSCSHCGWQEYEATSYTLDGVSGTGIVSTGKDFKGGDVVIPSTINGEQVLMIGNTWNDGVSLLTDEQNTSITSEKSLQV